MHRRLLALLSAVAVTVCGSVRPAAPADQPLTKMTFQMGSVPGSSWAAIYYAKQAGLFAKEGLDVDVLPGKTSQDAFNAVAAGSVTMAVVLSLTTVINADHGQKLVAVGSFLGRNSYGLVVGEDTGIMSLRDLGGKKILTTAPIYQSLLQGLIKKAGGNPDATTYILVPNPAGLIGTYVGKAADGMETVIPYAQSAAGSARPSRYFLFSELGDAEPGYVFVVKPETLQNQRSTVQKALRAIYAAQAIVNSDESKMLDIALKTVPGSTETQEKADYEFFRKFQCDPAQRGKSYAYMPPKLWDDTVRLYRQIGVIEHPLDPKSLYTNEFAEGPDAVTSLKC